MVLVKCFGPFFMENRPGKCVSRYSIKKKRLSRLSLVICVCRVGETHILVVIFVSRVGECI